MDFGTKIQNPLQRHTIIQIMKSRAGWISGGDKVLDAGCGAGKTSSYLAAKYNANFIGITLSTQQYKIAKKRERENLKFALLDFDETGFPDESFEKIFTLESLVHSNNKQRTLSELFRILKREGKICIFDVCLTKDNLSAKEKEIEFLMRRGWAISSPVLHKKNIVEILQQCGFQNIQYEKKTENIYPSSKRIYWMGKILYPISFVLSRLGIIPKSTHFNSEAMIAQKKVIDEGMGDYFILTADKL